ncbi:MAG: hypothetical protein DMD81_10100 [Candidatus Rokuibacteriota bacterium]|nr:MAG: hypothetical protein DMD81_10100 [Candidatus Rokubacteria bacterium]
MARCWCPTTTPARSIGSRTSAEPGLVGPSSVTLDRLHEPRGASIGGRFAQTRRGGPGLARRSAFLIGTALLTSVIIPHAASAGDADAGRRKAETCAACHGPEGNSTVPTVPAIAGQPEVYLHWQLMLFRDNRRRDPQMTPLTASTTRRRSRRRNRRRGVTGTR